MAEKTKFERTKPHLLAIFILVTLFFGTSFAFVSAQVQQEEVVIFSQKFIRETAKPKTETVNFLSEIEGKGSLILVNGNPDGTQRISSAIIYLNDKKIITPNDLNQQIGIIEKQISLKTKNTLKIELRSKPDSFARIIITGFKPAEVLNLASLNPDKNFWALNMKESVVLWFVPPPASTIKLILYRSDSAAGPWAIAEEVLSDEFKKGGIGNIVDLIDGTVSDYYYKAEAVDESGKMVKEYLRVYVPKFVDNPGSFSSQSSFNPASPSVPAYNKQFLLDETLENYTTMSLVDIRSLLFKYRSFLATTTLKDVDGILIDPAQIIYNSSQNYKVNPQLIIATIQKESSAILLKNRPEDEALKFLTGYLKGPFTIRDQIDRAAAQFRRDFDRLTQGEPTAGGWRVGITKQTDDEKLVTPANKITTLLFSYTSYLGKRWGGGVKGGNALLIDVWVNTFKFHHTLIWQTCAFCPDSPEVNIQNNIINLGELNDAEVGYQNTSIHGVSALLPQLNPVIVYDYNFYTWDSYNQIGTPNPPYFGGTGYWDSFSVSFSAIPYWTLSLSDPISQTNLHGIDFIWGGISYGDGFLEQTSGERKTQVSADPSAPNYLNIILDTATLPEVNHAYPSWGTITIKDIELDLGFIY